MAITIQVAVYATVVACGEDFADKASLWPQKFGSLVEAAIVGLWWGLELPEIG